MLSNRLILLVIQSYLLAGTTSFFKSKMVLKVKTEKPTEENTILIEKVDDFKLTGSGSVLNWEKTK